MKSQNIYQKLEKSVAKRLLKPRRLPPRETAAKEEGLSLIRPKIKPCKVCGIYKPLSKFELIYTGDTLKTCRTCRGKTQYENQRIRRNSPAQKIKYLVRAKWNNFLKLNPSKSKIGKMCEKCGQSADHAHHKDYLKPFDVQWLCRKCHRDVHKNEEK